MKNLNYLIVCMGVSGTGKTTLARFMAEKLSVEFLEADGTDRRVVRLTDPETSTSVDIEYYTGTSGVMALADETAGIAQRVEHGYLHLGQVATEHDVSVRDWTGFRGVAHAGCIGFVLMAYWPEVEVAEYLAKDLEVFSERTVTDPEVVAERLALVRAQGYLWTTDEYAQGVTTVAAPVFDRSGEAVASLHVFGPSYRFPKPRRQGVLGRAVSQRADAISAVLGHREAA